MSGSMVSSGILEWDYISETLLPHMSFIMSNIYPYDKGHFESLKSKYPSDDTTIFAGSVMEGLSLPGFNNICTDGNIFTGLSDVDLMLKFPHVFCGERESYFDRNAHFFLESNNVHPGYALLEIQVHGCVAETKVSTLPNSDKIYFDSRKLQDSLEGTIETVPHGPALTVDKLIEVSNIFSEVGTDYVPAVNIPRWPYLAYEWKWRKRVSKWPPSNLVQKIAAGGCHVVPIGHPKSNNMGIEWRLSFSLAEIELSNHLTVTQKKCYILFKTLHKHAFKEPKGIVSYHLKMVFYWAMEEIPQQFWTEQSMGQMLLYLLDKLLHCLIQHNLPSYFIPSNNLIDTLAVDTVIIIKQKVAKVRCDPVRQLLQFGGKITRQRFNNVFQEVLSHGKNGNNACCSLQTCFNDVFYPATLRYIGMCLGRCVIAADLDLEEAAAKEENERKKLGQEDEKTDGENNQPVESSKNKQEKIRKEQHTKYSTNVNIDSVIDIAIYNSKLVTQSQHMFGNILMSVLHHQAFKCSEFDDIIVQVCDKVLERFPSVPCRLMFLQEIVSRIPTID